MKAKVRRFSWGGGGGGPTSTPSRELNKVDKTKAASQAVQHVEKAKEGGGMATTPRHLSHVAASVLCDF